MTKFNDKLMDLITRWFKTKKSLSITDYEMLKDLAYEVIK